MNRRPGAIRLPRLLWVVAVLGASALSVAPVRAQQLCGGESYPFPYTDVSAVGAAFCPGIMEAYVTGISLGTTPTTFSPNNTVIRLQMTTFLERTVDQVLTRGSRRAALKQFWTTQSNTMQNIAIGGDPIYCAADGADIWSSTGGEVVQVQGNTGVVLGTWTGATSGAAVVTAEGKVFVAGTTTPGSLYVIDPGAAPGPVVVAASTLGNQPSGIAFDGGRLWTANREGSVSIITPQASTPYPVMTITTGFTAPFDILYDGAHMWVTDQAVDKLFKLDSSGAIVQTVTVGSSPVGMVFDGANIWVMNYNDNSLTVVQASTGNVVATILPDVNNQLNGPSAASFDGERVLVTNDSGGSVTLFNAARLNLIGNVTIAPSANPYSACSDGIDFWVNAQGGRLLRF
jgi:DNA-binding beta-propeller fold protein YncE